MTEKQDLLRTTLVFHIGKHIEPHLKEVDPEQPDKFDLISLVSLGRITIINDHFQLMQRKMSPEQIQDFVNRADETGKTALFYACHYNYHNLILYLLLKGADPFLPDEKGRSPFHILCFKGLVEGVSIIWNFLKHNIRKNALAHLKHEKKHYNFLKSDIKKGILVSPDANMESVKKNFINFLPAIHSVYKTHYLDALFEIHQKALSQLDEISRTPIHYAAMNKYTKCYRASEYLLTNSYFKTEGYEKFNELFEELQLLELNIDKREDTKTYLPFLEQVEGYMDPEVFHAMNKKFENDTHQLQKKTIDHQDNDGYSPMHLASFYGDFLSVQLFLRLGGNSHITDYKDNKPVIDYASNGFVRNVLLDLQAAALKGDVASFDALLNCGNNIDERKTIYTVSPLHNSIQFAKEAGSEAMLTFILRCGANVNISDGSGWTALHHACKNGDVAACKILIENDADVNAISNKHYYPIHIAAVNNHDKVIALLLQSKAKIECENDEHCTPLLLAAKKGHCEALKVLLDAGADMYAHDHRKWTALHYAAYNNHGKAVNLLCKYDADGEKLREMENSSGKIPREISQQEDVKFQFHTLWKAAFDGHLDTIRRLKRFGEDADAQTRKKKLTPLIIAVQRHHLLVVKFLLDNGVNAELRDSQNKRAVDYAQEATLLIKKDKDGRKTIDPVKASKNEFALNKVGKREFYPDLVLRIEKIYNLFK